MVIFKSLQLLFCTVNEMAIYPGLYPHHLFPGSTTTVVVSPAAVVVVVVVVVVLLCNLKRELSNRKRFPCLHSPI